MLQHKKLFWICDSEELDVLRFCRQEVVVVDTDGPLDRLHAVGRNVGQCRLVARLRRRTGAFVLLQHEVENIRQRLQTFFVSRSRRRRRLWRWNRLLPRFFGHLLEGVKLGLREKTSSCKGGSGFRTFKMLMPCNKAVMGVVWSVNSAYGFIILVAFGANFDTSLGRLEIL